MSGPAVQGHGFTFTRETTPGGGTYAAIGNIVSADPPAITRNKIETTHAGSGGWEESIPGIKRTGTFDAVFNFDLAVYDQLKDDIQTQTVLSYRITAPDTGATVFEMDAYITNLKPTGFNTDTKIEVQATFQCTGALVLTT